MVLVTFIYQKSYFRLMGLRKKVIKHGATRAVAIPKSFFESVGEFREVDMDIIGDKIIIVPKKVEDKKATV